MKGNQNARTDKPGEYIFCRYIVKNGIRIYPTKSRVFRFKLNK